MHQPQRAEMTARRSEKREHVRWTECSCNTDERSTPPPAFGRLPRMLSIQTTLPARTLCPRTLAMQLGRLAPGRDGTAASE
eukprot:5085641-Pleurochrysis_carterae.AAC.4